MSFVRNLSDYSMLYYVIFLQFCTTMTKQIFLILNRNILINSIFVRPQQVKEFANNMLGHRLVTKQTGPEGKLVNKVLIARRYFLRRETYLALLLDRAAQGPVIISSSQGGMDIEKVAHENPNSIQKVSFDHRSSVCNSICRNQLM